MTNLSTSGDDEKRIQLMVDNIQFYLNRRGLDSPYNESELYQLVQDKYSELKGRSTVDKYLDIIVERIIIDNLMSVRK
ncbi:MAG: hypothetical protein HYW24_01395 [Candidatus Aenigmarchaeota archaeon]|nr:hypothetical protein [Candidatus Aenigmarchaeota archaeon]